ncbi:MAG: DNA repair protein [Roseiflexaceae bacterium]
MPLKTASRLLPYFELLTGHFAHEPAWWPIHTPHRDYEVTLGMVLVQQTRWEQVEAAVIRLLNAGYTTFAELADADPHHVGILCKPCAFYTRKGIALVTLAQHVRRQPYHIQSILALPRNECRQQLLSLPQIGRESADTIMLYGGHHPLFIVDAYARRFLARTGIYADQIDALKAPYDQLQHIIEADIGTVDVITARELHAMMVEICIHHCTATRPRCTQSGAVRRFVDPRKCAEHCPPCSGCPVAHECRHHQSTIQLLG